MNKMHLILVAALIVLIGGGAILYKKGTSTVGTHPEITTFEQCAAKYPVMESFPERCRTPEGLEFVNNTVSENVPEGVGNNVTEKDLNNKQYSAKGKIVCLPAKKGPGQDTLECAIGLKEHYNGEFYALSDPSMKFVQKLKSGSEVNITGKLVNNASESKYNIVGTIEIENVE